MVVGPIAVNMMNYQRLILEEGEKRRNSLFYARSSIINAGDFKTKSSLHLEKMRKLKLKDELKNAFSTKNENKRETVKIMDGEPAVFNEFFGSWPMITLSIKI